MKGLILAGCLSLWASSVSAQGWSIGVVDPPIVFPAFDSATIGGWAFHTGGAAITKVRVWLDCHPWMQGVTGCTPQLVQPYTYAFARPDVTAAFPAYPVPENAGFGLGIFGWSQVPDGSHWLYGAVQDAQHGEQWFLLNPHCFRKAGELVLPC